MAALDGLRSYDRGHRVAVPPARDELVPSSDPAASGRAQ